MKSNSGKILAFWITCLMIAMSLNSIVSIDVDADFTTDIELEFSDQQLRGNITYANGSYAVLVVDLTFLNTRTNENVSSESINNGTFYEFNLTMFNQGYMMNDEIHISGYAEDIYGRAWSGETTIVVNEQDNIWVDIELINLPPFILPLPDPIPDPDVISNDGNQNNGSSEEMSWIELESLRIQPGYRYALENEETNIKVTIKNSGGATGNEEYAESLLATIEEIDVLINETVDPVAKTMLQVARQSLNMALNALGDEKYGQSFTHVATTIISLELAGERGVETADLVIDLVNAVKNKVNVTILHAENIFGYDNFLVVKAWESYNEGLAEIADEEYHQAVIRFRVAFVFILQVYNVKINVELVDTKPDGSEELIGTSQFGKMQAGQQKTKSESWFPEQKGRHFIKTTIIFKESFGDWKEVWQGNESVAVLPNEQVIYWNDMVISEPSTYENVTIISIGNLSIQAETTFQNVSLIIDPPIIKTYWNIDDTITIMDSTVWMDTAAAIDSYIRVNEPNGRLKMIRSIITATNTNEGYYFEVFNQMLITSTDIEFVEDGIKLISKTLQSRLISSKVTNGFGPGIVANGFSPFIINTEISDNWGTGIYIEKDASIPQESRIEYCTITNNIDGIKVIGGTPSIKENTIKENLRNGINIVDGSPVIRNNHIENNRYGIIVIHGSPLIEENVFELNLAGLGIITYSGENPVVRGNVINTGESHSGIIIRFGEPIIEDNVLTGISPSSNRRYGIFDWYSSPTITGNTITGYVYGIYNTESSPIIQNNIITGDLEQESVGICFEGISSASVVGNTIQNNKACGIYSDGQSLCIESNTIKNNGFGIYSVNMPIPVEPIDLAPVTKFSDGTDTTSVSFDVNGYPNSIPTATLPKESVILSATMDIKGLYNHWTLKQPMIQPRVDPSSTTYNNEIYIAGGTTNGYTNNVIKSVEKYSPDIGWTSLADMNDKRVWFPLVTLNNYIFAIGGQTGPGIYLSTVERYEPSTNTWDKNVVPSLSMERACHCAIVWNGEIYVFGGVDELGNSINSVEVYNPQSNEWRLETPSPNLGFSLCSAILNDGNGDKFYLISSSGFYKYEPPDSWVILQNSPTTREFFTTCVSANKLYVIGGNRDSTLYTINEEYDPSFNTWKSSTPMTIARWRLTSSVINDRIYVIGGGTTYSSPIIATNENEEFLIKPPRNPCLDIGNDRTIIEWEYTEGDFTRIVTIDDTNTNPFFTQALQSYLDTSVDHLVDVPIALYSESAGEIETSNLKIIFGSKDASIISKNTISGNAKSGLYVSNSDYTTIYNNIITANGVHGIELFSSNFCLISSNSAILNNNMGIYMSDCNNNYIFENSCEQNGNCGIYLFDSKSNTISKNTLRHQPCGLSLRRGEGPEGSDNNLIETNDISFNSGFGILTGSNENIFENNNIVENGVIGIKAQESIGGSISGNLIESNGDYGILMVSSETIDIENNKIIGHNKNGIRIVVNPETSSSTLAGSIIGNQISSNAMMGIRATYIKPTNADTLESDNTFGGNGEGWIWQEWGLRVHTIFNGIDVESFMMIIDLRTNVIFQDCTNTQGYTPWLAVTEYKSMNDGYRDYYTEHIIQTKTYYGETYIPTIHTLTYIDCNKEILISYVDSGLPKDPSLYIDAEGDGLSYGEEIYTYDTIPNLPDSDFDGYYDGWHDENLNGLWDEGEEKGEKFYTSNALGLDSDGDGIDDGSEVLIYNTDPNDKDSDDNGYIDGDLEFDTTRIYICESDANTILKTIPLTREVLINGNAKQYPILLYDPIMKSEPERQDDIVTFIKYLNTPVEEIYLMETNDDPSGIPDDFISYVSANTYLDADDIKRQEPIDTYLQNYWTYNSVSPQVVVFADKEEYMPYACTYAHRTFGAFVNKYNNIDNNEVTSLISKYPDIPKIIYFGDDQIMADNLETIAGTQREFQQFSTINDAERSLTPIQLPITPQTIVTRDVVTVTHLNDYTISNSEMQYFKATPIYSSLRQSMVIGITCGISSSFPPQGDQLVEDADTELETKMNDNIVPNTVNKKLPEYMTICAHWNTILYRKQAGLTTDQFVYSDFDNDDMPDIAVGRLVSDHLAETVILINRGILLDKNLLLNGWKYTFACADTFYGPNPEIFNSLDQMYPDGHNYQWFAENVNEGGKAVPPDVLNSACVSSIVWLQGHGSTGDICHNSGDITSDKVLQHGTYSPGFWLLDGCSTGGGYLGKPLMSAITRRGGTNLYVNTASAGALNSGIIKFLAEGESIGNANRLLFNENAAYLSTTVYLVGDPMVHYAGKQDNDYDDMPDLWEVQYGLDPNNNNGIHGRDGDFDGDTITNYEEYQVYESDPTITNWVGYFINGVSLYNKISTELTEYTNALFNQFGIQTKVFYGNWNKGQLRNKLIDCYYQNDESDTEYGMIGAVFVGHAPDCLYYSHFDSWYDGKKWVEQGNAEIHVTDLYYADLNGRWGDKDGDTIYDVHCGYIKPEIWIGQLRPTTTNLDETASLLKGYFSKVISYLEEDVISSKEALCFIDDDWGGYTGGPIGNGDQYEVNVQQAYEFTELIDISTDTTANNYFSLIQQPDYEFVYVMSEGGSTEQQFKVDGVEELDYVTSTPSPTEPYDLTDINENARFYYIGSEHSTDFYDEPDNYITGEYVFGSSTSMGAIGSSKNGRFLGNKMFFSRINDGVMLGTAWLGWWRDIGTNITQMSADIIWDDCINTVETDWYSIDNFNIADGTTWNKFRYEYHEQCFGGHMFIGDPTLSFGTSKTFDWHLQQGLNIVSLPMSPVYRTGSHPYFDAQDALEWVNSYLQDFYGVIDTGMYIQNRIIGTNPSEYETYGYGNNENVAFQMDGVHGYWVYLSIAGDYVIPFKANDYALGENTVTLEAGYNLLGFTHNGVPWANVPRAKDFATGVIDPDLDINLPDITHIVASWWTGGSWIDYVYWDWFPGLEPLNWAWDFSYSNQPGNGFMLYVDKSLELNFPVDY